MGRITKEDFSAQMEALNGSRPDPQPSPPDKDATWLGCHLKVLDSDVLDLLRGRMSGEQMGALRTFLKLPEERVSVWSRFNPFGDFQKRWVAIEGLEMVVAANSILWEANFQGVETNLFPVRQFLLEERRNASWRIVEKVTMVALGAISLGAFAAALAPVAIAAAIGALIFGVAALRQKGRRFKSEEALAFLQTYPAVPNEAFALFRERMKS